MSKIIIEVLLTFIKGLVSTFLGPVFSAIDGLVSGLGLTSYIDMFNNVLYSYIAPFVGFFFEFMGPITISVLLLEFTVFVAYYTITMGITWILKVLKVIKKFPMA